MLSVKEKDMICGFEVEKIQEAKEINSKTYLMKHNKSGARLFYIENDDENKTFGIGFKTTPENSTGVFHILEHSVLCGSKKYPVKEPFVELIKSSLQNFLNAFTFPDKTIYPFSTTNEKDFTNLMQVYTDAVFNPSIYEKPEIFMQEGWSYGLNENDELFTSGVVLNEMKGAYSSRDTLLMNNIDKVLFPDTCYGFSSGGDPKEIVKLTYDEFLNTHKKYYSPNNSYIFLYGKMNVEEKLEFLDREYLSKIENLNDEIKIDKQGKIDKKEIVEYYSISKDEEEKDNTLIALAGVMADFDDKEKIIAGDIVFDYLLETNESPLKKAVLEKELAKDVFGGVLSGILQPYFILQLQNSNDKDTTRLKEVVNDVVKKVINDGIDKEYIHSSLDRLEFKKREGETGYYPKGIYYMIKMFDFWLYGGNPVDAFSYDETIKNLHKLADEGYFEKLLSEMLINNDNMASVVLLPSKTLLDEELQKEKEFLSNKKESMTSDELNDIIEKSKKLKEFQQSQDTKENLQKLPKLSINDISKDELEIPLEEKEINDRKVLYHNIFTNKIVYVKYYFDLNHLSEDEILYLTILSELFSDMPTKNTDLSHLQKKIRSNLGDFNTTIKSYQDIKKDNSLEGVSLKFCVSFSMSEEKISKALDLVDEILIDSIFDNKDIMKIVEQYKISLESSMMQSGHLTALVRMSSYYSYLSKYLDMLEGIEQLKFTQDILKENRDISTTLENIVKKIFVKDNMIISIAGSEKAFGDVVNYESRIPDTKIDFKNKLQVSLNQDTNEGFVIPADIAYVTMGYNFGSLGYDYNGAMQVVAKIASLQYLWNKVRVQGGAYGAGLIVGSSKNLSYYSYRDPNVKDTINSYKDTASFLNDLEMSQEEIDSFIISTVAGRDKPLTPKQKAVVGDEIYFKNISKENIRKERNEILSTTIEDIKHFAKILDSIDDKYFVCAVGNSEKIENSKEYIKSIKSLK